MSWLASQCCYSLFAYVPSMLLLLGFRCFFFFCRFRWLTALFIHSYSPFCPYYYFYAWLFVVCWPFSSLLLLLLLLFSLNCVNCDCMCIRKRMTNECAFMLNILSDTHTHIPCAHMNACSNIRTSKCGGAYSCVLPTLRFRIDCVPHWRRKNVQHLRRLLSSAYSVYDLRFSPSSSSTSFVVVAVRFYCRKILIFYFVHSLAGKIKAMAVSLPYHIRCIQVKTNETLAKCKMKSTQDMHSHTHTHAHDGQDDWFRARKRIESNNAQWRKTPNDKKNEKIRPKGKRRPEKTSEKRNQLILIYTA